MSIPGSSGALFLATAAGAGGYQIERSLRFNSSDSAYLSRTPASAGNRKTWTWAGWVKRSKLGTGQTLFRGGAGTTNSTYVSLYLRTDDAIDFGGWLSNFVRTPAVFRDCSAWYHIVLAVDTTLSSNRIRLYVNGVEQTLTQGGGYPAQNDDLGVNQAALHTIGGNDAVGGYSDLYLADVHLIDGQQLTPSSFGEFDTNNVWQPKSYSGSYGTNGFRLPFSDNSGTTSTTLGKDSAGSNNWTPNNFSVASGSGNDSLVDSPSSPAGQTDSGAGGEVRGNYCTWNPLGTAGPASSNGNLDIASSSTAGNKIGTILLTSGKWYWECVGDGYAGAVVGVGGEGFTGSVSSTGSKAIGYWFGGGIYWDGGSFTSGIASYTTSDVIGIAVDMTAGTVAFYKNNSLVYTATFGSGTVPNLSSGVYPGFNTGNPGGSARTVIANFGQRPFAYTAPSGFKALCTANLPTPTIEDGSMVMDVKLYTGNGSTQTISGLNFSPDLVWIKTRSAAANHRLLDTIRGATKELYANLTNAEGTDANGLTAFNSDGFSLGNSSGYNDNAVTHVAWTWDAGSSTVTNTQGSITSSVRANASAGFSVVTYTVGSNTSQTIGHGLGVAPQMIIVKERNQANNWQVYHTSLGNGNYIYLNGPNAVAAANNLWNNTSPTSTVFSIRSGGSANFYDGKDHVAYCWTPVAGYSSFGSFVASSTTSGQFVYLGFRARWILIKATTAVTYGSWRLVDTARSPYNGVKYELYPNLANAETDYGAGDWCDIVSNGFVLKQDFGAGTYIWAAFAENPFSLARAR